MMRSLLRFALVLCLVVATFAPLAFAQPAAPTAASTAPATTSVSAPPPAPAASSARPMEPLGPPPPAKAANKGSFTDAIPCSACHTTTAWRAKGEPGEDTSFDHATLTAWPLTGKHAKTECVKCHAMTTVAGEAKQTIRWRLSSNDCKFCHANPHEMREQL